MASDLSFACECGAVSGTLLGVGAGQGDHVVCHCTDCQDLARYLGHAGRVLDAHGGTALYQSRCARLRSPDRQADAALVCQMLRHAAVQQLRERQDSLRHDPARRVRPRHARSAGRPAAWSSLYGGRHRGHRPPAPDEHGRLDVALFPADDQGHRLGRSPAMRAFRRRNAGADRQAPPADQRRTLALRRD